ncbi:hypothetical protein A3N58_14460 [Klebsiella aerogenes]|nr:hypothetical protein A3N58_14460 [Klebsiella aerogenes]
MAGGEFSAGEYQLQLLEYQRKGLVEAQRMLVAESTVKPGAVREKMQAVAFLHQTCSKTGGHSTFQPPLLAGGILRYGTGF